MKETAEIIISKKAVVITKTPVKKKHYINEEFLLKEIIISKEQGFLTKDAEKMLILLANKIIEKKLYFLDPSVKDDCLQTSIYVLLTKWQKFDHLKYNKPFAYYSEISKRALAQGFNQAMPALYGGKKKGDPKGKIKLVSLSGTSDCEGVTWI